MLHLTFQHIGNRLDPAMGMPRKALLIRVRLIIAKIVKQQKRIQHGWVTKAEGAVQMHAGTLHGRLGKLLRFYGPDGHRGAYPVGKV